MRDFKEKFLWVILDAGWFYLFSGSAALCLSLPGLSETDYEFRQWAYVPPGELKYLPVIEIVIFWRTVLIDAPRPNLETYGLGHGVRSVARNLGNTLT